MTNNDSSQLNFLHQVTDELAASYSQDHAVSFGDDMALPQREKVIAVLDEMLELLFPGYSGRYNFYQDSITYSTGDHLNLVYQELTQQIARALCYRCRVSGHPNERPEDCSPSARPRYINPGCRTESARISGQLLKKLPEIRQLLLLDCQAALDGDPATRSADEIILSYPGFKAISIHRIAHELYAAGVPLIPRIMSEYSHSLTGIDINPGATIGKSFFIDHGTGVVIGETAILGDNIKIYQGVTLGALSFPKDGCGQLIKGAKRHPNLEDNVTVYAGATILGNITIAHHSVIGGNVWLTDSIEEPYSRVIFSPSDVSIRVSKKPIISCK